MKIVFAQTRSTQMEQKLVEAMMKYFPKSHDHIIVVTQECICEQSIMFLDCVIASLVHVKNRLGIRALHFHDCCFTAKECIISFLQTTARVARHGSLDMVTVSGKLVDEYSFEFFRTVTSALASFREVNLTSMIMPQRHYGYILGALATSAHVVGVNVVNLKILVSDESRAEIKTSSGAIGSSNPLFLYEVAARLSPYIPSDVWSSGWVFQEAQRMVMYVVQNSFLATVPASVGVNLFVCACAFVIGRSDVSWWEREGMELVLRESMRRCSASPDPCTNLIMGVVQTEAGFLPGPTQSTFGLNTVPKVYVDFHTHTLEPSVMKHVDPRSKSEIRTWLDVATLPFLFANLVRTKVVTGEGTVDELFTWALDVL
jgi:hypothetical protein